ncbi:MAG: DUF21 domain-containing protein, partial [Firmicutes bacterium]|nr:DUF21 domain-containing protein [Bacillota bacterium]
MIGNILLIVCLIFLSAVFSGSEIAFASSSEVKLRKAAEEAKRASSKNAFHI